MLAPGLHQLGQQGAISGKLLDGDPVIPFMRDTPVGFADQTVGQAIMKGSA